MRVFHIQLEQRLENRISFFYLRTADNHQQRSYEQGGLPHASRVWDEESISWRGLLREITSINPAIICFNGLYPRHLLFVLLYCQLFRKKKIKLWYWVDHNLLSMLNESAWRIAARKVAHGTLLKRMDKLLYVGSRTRDFYAWLLGPRHIDPKCWWLPYPHLWSTPTAYPTANVRGRIRLLYVGRLAPEKGIDMLLRALSLLAPNIAASVELTIAGDGPSRHELKQLWLTLSRGTNVTFLGSVSSDKIVDIYARHDVMVLPSHTEPWGLVVNEALSAGLPVVAPYWVGAVADLVDNQVNGIVTESNSPASLAEAITQLVSTHGLLARLQEACRNDPRVRRWSLDASVKQFMQLVAHEG